MLLSVEPATLLSALKEVDLDQSEYPEEAIIRNLAPDVDLEGGNDAVFFHMSRVGDPETFRRDGLLPRSRVIDQLWADAAALNHDQSAYVDWPALRLWLETANGYLPGRYQVRQRSEHDGPYGVLLREPLLRPSSFDNHYLQLPETMQDILDAVKERHSVDLSAQFRAATLPVIVTFAATPKRGEPRMRDLIVDALQFIRVQALEGWQLDCAGCSFDGFGEALPPSAVIDVAVVEPPSPERPPLAGPRFSL